MKDGLYWVQQLKEQKVSRIELLKDIEKKVQKLNPKINGFVTFDSQEAEATYQKNKQQDTLFAGLPFPLKMLGQEKRGGQQRPARNFLKIVLQQRPLTLSNKQKRLA